MFSIQACVDQ